MSQEYDPTNTQALAVSQSDRDDKGKAELRVEVDDLKWLMNDKRGRRFVFKLLNRAGVFRISFHTNAMTMAFNEGNRNAGLKMLNDIMEHCPTRYVEMQEESKG